MGGYLLNFYISDIGELGFNGYNVNFVVDGFLVFGEVDVFVWFVWCICLYGGRNFGWMDCMCYGLLLLVLFRKYFRCFCIYVRIVS